MRNFQDIFEIRRRLFVSAFSICMTVPLSSEIFFCSFQLFGNGHTHNVGSTLINVVKLDVENNSIALTSNVAKGAEATCVKIASEMKKCFRLKDMLNFNVL